MNLHDNNLNPNDDTGFTRLNEKQRREPPRQQPPLLNTLQNMEADTTPPVTGNPPEPPPKTGADDPFMGIPEKQRNDMQLHKFDDGRDIPDYSGVPLPPDARKQYVQGRKQRLSEHPQDIKDVLFLIDLKRDPSFREQAERVSRNLREPSPAKTPLMPPGGEIYHTRPLPYRTDGNPPENRIRTLELPHGQNNARVSPAHDILEQTAHIHDPQDISTAPVWEAINRHAIRPLGDNPLWENNPPGIPDTSMKPATDALARNITDNLGDKGAVTGRGRMPPGHPDISYGAAFGSPSKNMGMESAVTGHGRQIIEAPNMTYWPDRDNEDSRDLPLQMSTDGVKQGWKDAQIMFYSGSSLLGELLHRLVGGDDTALRQVQGILDRHQEDLKNMNRLTLDDIFNDDPEKTMQNITRYLYQELGNQTVRLPAYYIAKHLNTFAQLFGVSATVLSTQLYADFREKTGDGHPVESIMYGIPLGLMSAALLPFRDKLSFQSAREMKDYVRSFIAGTIVHQAQQGEKKKIVEYYGQNTKRSD